MLRRYEHLSSRPRSSFDSFFTSFAGKISNCSAWPTASFFRPTSSSADIFVNASSALKPVGNFSNSSRSFSVGSSTLCFGRPRFSVELSEPLRLCVLLVMFNNIDDSELPRKWFIGEGDGPRDSGGVGLLCLLIAVEREGDDLLA